MTNKSVEYSGEQRETVPPSKSSKQGSGGVEDRPDREDLPEECTGAHTLSLPRTLTQEDPGDNQITLEEITQMVSRVTISFDHQGNLLHTLITP